MAGEITEISGAVDRVLFKSPDNGYSVIALKVSASESIVARGYFAEVHQGAQVTLTGQWAFHAKFGRQFDAQSCTTSLPSSIVGIEKYLGSGLIKGIGPKFAEKLVKKFGAQTLEIIEQTPSRLFEVAGVGQKRVDLITQAWQEQKEISKVMIFLRSKDVPTTFAVKIFKKYGQESIAKMQENPYRLVDDIWGVGFKTADSIALKMGLAHDSIERVKASMLHVLSQATTEGHLYKKVEATKEAVIELIGLDATLVTDLLKRSLVELYQQEKVKLITYENEHFLALPQFYYSEIGISKKILKLQEQALSHIQFDTHSVYQSLRTPDKKGIELNEDQQQGILTCLQNKITIITGGPGTGKTTTTRRLIEVLEEHKARFRLAAPTGRAAKRMFESTGRNTETLHRLLEFTPLSMGFARNEQNALEIDFLIVDEASMIDVFLMHSVLKAMPQNASLVLLGDIDQLPSVGAGNVLHDLIGSEIIPVIRLTQIFRQAQDSMIIVNAHRVNHGEFPQAALPGSKKDFAFVKQNEPEEMFPLLRTIYKTKLPALGISPDDAIVLTPMNRGTAGAIRLNQELQMILNPDVDETKQVVQFGQVFKVRDRVMQIRNNYDKFVFNGDIGTILDIDRVNLQVIVRFGERDLEYDFTEMNELMLSYAISIHKSQGSEFQAVIIPLFMQHFMLLQRNLIYTAITRAKKLCVLVGQTKAVAMGINNNKQVDRLTFLKQFLTSNLQAR
jgi:exodeoxyribonuclease V alpha subunit